MIAPTAPAVVALATFCANENEPREMSAMLPLTLVGQSDGDPARPQLMSVLVMPRDFVVPANSRPHGSKFCVVAPDASKPWPFGTEESTSTPGPDRSMPPPVFEKLAWLLKRSTAPTDRTTS